MTNSSRNTNLSIVTVAAVILLSAMATRLIEQVIAQWVNLTTVAGGGLVSLSDVVSGDSRSITMALLKLLIPGVLIQAFIIKFGVQLLTTFRVPYIQAALALLLFDIGAIALMALLAHEFAKAQGLGALTMYTPWTLFFSVGMSVAILLFEAMLIRGISRPHIGRYPAVAYVRRAV